MLSARTALDAPPNALTLALARLRREGRPVRDLSESNPTRAGIPYDSSAILAALSDPRAMQYSPEPFGLPSARAVVARALAEHGYSRSEERRVGKECSS